MKGFYRKVWEIYKPFRMHLLVEVVLVLSVEVLGLGMPVFSGLLLTNLYHHSPIGILLLLGMLLVAPQLVAGFLDYLKDIYEIRHLDLGVTKHIEKLTIKKLFELSLGQHRQQNSGVINNSVVEGKDAVAMFATCVLYELLPIAARAVITVGALMVVNLFLGFIAAISVVVFVIISLRSNKTYRDPLNEVQQLKRSKGKEFWTIVQHITLFKLNSHEQKAAERFEEKSAVFESKANQVWSAYALTRFLHGYWLQATSCVLILSGIGLYWFGLLTVGQFVTSLLLRGTIVGNISGVLQLHRKLYRYYLSGTELTKTLEAESNLRIVEDPTEITTIGAIEFRSVCFTYPTCGAIISTDESKTASREQALRSVSFVVNHGERVALVGPSGAGKTSIIQLLLRAYDPSCGQVLVDGIDLRDIDLGSFYHKIGLVEQGDRPVDGTIQTNLMVGANGNSDNITCEMMEDALGKAALSDWYSQLSDGLETIVGDRGILISEGQKQRLAIARMLLRDGIELLILDEPTSNIDANNEGIILDALNLASTEMTVIVIAHRLCTIMDFDKIIVLDKGRIIAQGRHEELVSETSGCNLYRSMAKKQGLVNSEAVVK